jgi:hypothetical protein
VSCGRGGAGGPGRAAAGNRCRGPAAQGCKKRPCGPSPAHGLKTQDARPQKWADARKKQQRSYYFFIIPPDSGKFNSPGAFPRMTKNGVRHGCSMPDAAEGVKLTARERLSPRPRPPLWGCQGRWGGSYRPCRTGRSWGEWTSSGWRRSWRCCFRRPCRSYRPRR